MNGCQHDILPQHEALHLPLKSDDKGELIATLVHRINGEGSTKAVLYVHGFNDYYFQEEMANQFVEKGYDFYALDLRRYGRSYRPHQRFNHSDDLKEPEFGLSEV